MRISVKSAYALIACVAVVFLMSPATLAVVAPNISGGLEMSLQGDNQGNVTATADLQMYMHVDARGANRAYVELGVHPGKVSLGSATYPWGSWNPQIRRAWIEHTAPLYHGGQTVNYRIGQSPFSLSPNIGKFDRFQGIRISNLDLKGINTVLFYGWDAPTGSLPRDEIAGLSASTRLLGTDVAGVFVRSSVLDALLWELNFKRPLTRTIELDALLFSDGFTHPYFYTFSTWFNRSTQLAVTFYDYGQFDTTRYHYVGEDYRFYNYSNKFYGIETTMSGELWDTEWKLGYHSWDDLVIRHVMPSLELRRLIGPVHVAYEIARDQTIQETTTNKLSLSTRTNAIRGLQGLEFSLDLDWATAQDQVVFKTKYQAPNKVNYEIQHGSDSGWKWSIQTKVEF